MIEGFLFLKEKIIMKKILEFFENKMNYIMFFLVFVIFLKTCNTNSKVEAVSKSIKSTNNTIDSFKLNVDNSFKTMYIEIKVEGLKSEKRMIQSTDRKILDVNRQSEIDKEISSLEK